MSDEHASYVCIAACKSRLARLGFYHFWVNHSCEYAHKKFTFLSTCHIESLWGRFKNSGIKGIVAHNFRVPRLL